MDTATGQAIKILCGKCPTSACHACLMGGVDCVDCYITRCMCDVILKNILSKVYFIVNCMHIFIIINKYFFHPLTWFS